MHPPAHALRGGRSYWSSPAASARPVAAPPAATAAARETYARELQGYLNASAAPLQHPSAAAAATMMQLVAMPTGSSSSSSRALASSARPPGVPADVPVLLANGHYALTGKIGGGAYGTVFSARSQHSGRSVAVKMESASAPYPQLAVETDMLLWLEEQGCADIIPCVSANGRTPDGRWLYTVMERLGDNLLDIVSRCGGRFSEPTALRLLHTMITIFERLHAAHIMHRDVKPENFCIRTDDPSAIAILDFGMSKAFIDSETGEHIPAETGHAFMGTPRYVSLNCHAGCQLSRRDDLISSVYICIYMMKGSLPWRHLEDELETRAGRADPMAVYNRIADMKRAYTPMRLADEYNLPESMRLCLEYASSLDFEATPRYDRMRNWIVADLRALHATELNYDWVTTPSTSSSASTTAPAHYGASRTTGAHAPPSGRR